MMEYIVDYVTLLSNLITSIISYKIITKEKINIKFKKIMLLVMLTFYSLLIRYTNIGILIIVSNVLFIFIILKYWYNVSFIKNFYFCIVISVISLFADALISIFLNNTDLINFNILIKKYYFRQLLNVPVCLLIFLISYLPFIKNGINIFYERYIFRIKLTKKLFLLFGVVMFIFLIFFCLNAYNNVSKIGHILTILGILSFSILFIITLNLLYREFQIKILNDNIIEENKYIKNIAKQDEEFKHNIINNLLGVKTIANKKTNILIDDLINSYKKEYKNITNINDLPNGIQSIIYRKAYEENIDNLNLIVNNKIKKELYDILTPRQYNNLCTVIGILFDNALDAVKNKEEKIIEIIFEEVDFNIIVIIKNSFTNMIDLDEIGKRNFTTKKNGHGIGVSYIRKLKTISMKNEIINNMFITKLEIKKIKKI